MNNIKDRQKLIDIFLEKNSQINLSAIRDAQGVYYKHILDSLELNNILKIEEGATVIDLGTGGGFPLLPLAISNPQAHFIAIDSKNKKLKAIQYMIEKYGNIGNIELVHNTVGQESPTANRFSKKSDIVTARAVAYADKLLYLMQKLCKPGGVLVLYKQQDKQESSIIKNYCKSKNIEIEKIHNYSLFDGDIKRVIYILKNK